MEFHILEYSNLSYYNKVVDLLDDNWWKGMIGSEIGFVAAAYVDQNPLPEGFLPFSPPTNVDVLYSQHYVLTPLAFRLRRTNGIASRLG
jgi:hypothetical protein